MLLICRCSMPKKVSKGQFHPSRISGHQKMLRTKLANELLSEEAKIKNRRKKIKPLDLSKGDWSKKS